MDGSVQQGVVNSFDERINPATEETLQQLLNENVVAWDSILATYPSGTTEVYTYKLSGITVKTITVVYTTTAKTTLDHVTKA